MARQFETVDQYVEACPIDVRPLLESIRGTIRMAVPDSVEVISYQMPSCKWNGKYLIHFGAWKKHIGVYPIPDGTPEFQKRVAPYVKGKGTVQFLLRDPIPLDIVHAMVTFRMSELLSERVQAATCGSTADSNR